MCPEISDEFNFCSSTDNSCNDSTTKNLNGTGTSQIYKACNDLNAGTGLGNRTKWRVATKDEVKTVVFCSDKTTMPSDLGNCPTPQISPLTGLPSNTTGAIMDYYATTVTRIASDDPTIWTATSYSTESAWVVDSKFASVRYNPKNTKQKFFFCVSEE